MIALSSILKMLFPNFQIHPFFWQHQKVYNSLFQAEDQIYTLAQYLKIFRFPLKSYSDNTVWYPGIKTNFIPLLSSKPSWYDRSSP